MLFSELYKIVAKKTYFRRFQEESPQSLPLIRTSYSLLHNVKQVLIIL